MSVECLRMAFAVFFFSIILFSYWLWNGLEVLFTQISKEYKSHIEEKEVEIHCNADYDLLSSSDEGTFDK